MSNLSKGLLEICKTFFFHIIRRYLEEQIIKKTINTEGNDEMKGNFKK